MTFFNPLLTALSQARAASFNFFSNAMDVCIAQYKKLQASLFAFKQRFSSSDSTSKSAYPKSFGLFPEVPVNDKRYANKDTSTPCLMRCFLKKSLYILREITTIYSNSRKAARYRVLASRTVLPVRRMLTFTKEA